MSGNESMLIEKESSITIFIDIDLELEGRFGALVPYMWQHGYKNYPEMNSALADELFEQQSLRTVFSMPAGHLAYQK